MLTTDFDRVAAQFAAAVDMAELQHFADGLRLSVRGLVRLGVGWSANHRAWSFPMKQPTLRVTGIRLRSWASRKWAVTGSQDGLFIPASLTLSRRRLVAEGPTDTAALLDLGFEAVGRPSCSGGVRSLVGFVQDAEPEDAVIVADTDPNGAGQRGAEVLATALLAYCPVRVITPPPGIKDVRQWKQAGATHQDVAARIETAPSRKLTVRARLQLGSRRKT